MAGRRTGRGWPMSAARGGRRVIDVYTIGVEGGEEVRLTQGEGHCDGPDYSADGARIYYNCDRGGHAQIWVMAADGAGQRKLFADDYVNWFPHPSPDGRHLVYLAYPPGTLGHPRDLPVALVLCDPDGGNRRRGRAFTGGQGTINVPSWAPDGSHSPMCAMKPDAAGQLISATGIAVAVLQSAALLTHSEGEAGRMRARTGVGEAVLDEENDRWNWRSSRNGRAGSFRPPRPSRCGKATSGGARTPAEGADG